MDNRLNVTINTEHGTYDRIGSSGLVFDWNWYTHQKIKGISVNDKYRVPKKAIEEYDKYGTDDYCEVFAVDNFFVGNVCDGITLSKECRDTETSLVYLAYRIGHHIPAIDKSRMTPKKFYREVVVKDPKSKFRSKISPKGGECYTKQGYIKGSVFDPSDVDNTRIIVLPEFTRRTPFDKCGYAVKLVYKTKAGVSTIRYTNSMREVKQCLEAPICGTVLEVFINGGKGYYYQLFDPKVVNGFNMESLIYHLK